MRIQLRSVPLMTVSVVLLLAIGVPSSPASPDTPPGATFAGVDEPPSYAIRVTNRSQRSVTVYMLRGGPPLRLGRVHPGQVARLPANCSDFLTRETDFELRSVAGRYRLEGETIGDCGQTIEIEVLPIGLEFSRVRVVRDLPPGRAG